MMLAFVFSVDVGVAAILKVEVDLFPCLLCLDFADGGGKRESPFILNAMIF